MKNYQVYIEINNKKMTGKPVIKGTRITVELILRLLAKGVDFNEIKEAYPHLKKEHILACLEYARQLLEGEKIYPIDFGKKIKSQAVIVR